MKYKALALSAWLGCASFGVLSLVPADAAAQDAPSANDKLAQTRFDQGKAAFKKKKYDAARKALLDAYQLRPNDETALYLGLSSVKAKKPGDGARYLKKYLAATEGTSSPERDQAEAALAEATKKLGTIEVLAPRATEIYLDGSTEKVGVTPMEPLLVEPGSHSLRGRTADGATLAQDVKVKVGEKAQAKLGDPNANPAPVEDDKNEKPEIGKSEEPKKKESGPGLFAPPKTMVPVVVALGVTGIGLAGALVFGLSRGNAQSAADDVDGQIRNNFATKFPGSNPAGACASTDASIQFVYGGPCAQLQKNRDAVDSNALLTNISFGVAGVGLVAAIGLYLFLPKAEHTPPPKKTDAWRNTHKSPLGSFQLDAVGPMQFGNRGQGLGLTGRF